MPNDGVPVSGPSASVSYASTDQAALYFSGRLHTEAWDCASSTDKSKALVQATRSIDRLNFAGLRTSEYNVRRAFLPFIVMGTPLPPSTPGQPLEFPRNGDTLVPDDIVSACCEIALALLDGVDPEMEMASLASLSPGFSSARTSFDTSEARMAFRHGIASQVAWGYIYPYLSETTEFVIKRVN